MAALMMELTQSRVGGTGMKVFTFAFDMLMTLCMAVSHSFCEVLIFRLSVNEHVRDAYHNKI